MKFNLITLFPEMFHGALDLGVVGQAKKKGLMSVHLVNPRSYSEDVHKTVDDRPFGGGDGMVMLAEPLKKALLALRAEHTLGRVVYMSPQGEPWSDEKARRWSQDDQPITIICGRYGGIDQRVISEFVDEQVSIGDYVLSGGEIAAMAVVDSTVRLLPGVLGNSESPQQESFADQLLEGPSFTRPREFDGSKVPETLLSGNHKKIEDWRRAISVLTTYQKRPDLLKSQLNWQEQLSEALNFAQQLSDEELATCGLDPKELR